MLEFIKIAYCVSIPLLLLLSYSSFLNWQKYAINLISLSNILLIGYSIYLAWQLVAMYQFAKQFSLDQNTETHFDMVILARMALVFLLPFFSLHRAIRRNRIYTLAMVMLLFWVFPPFSWSVFDMGYKIPAYFCLLCSAYALFWLLNQLPHQSRPQ